MQPTRPQPPASRAHSRRRGVVAGAVLLLVALALAALLILREDGPLPRDGVAVVDPGADFPFAYSDDRRAELEERAAAGLSHVLYEKSPGGVTASAERTAQWRDQVEAVAERDDLDPDLLEAIVLLESAGRPDAAADAELEGAVGLTQILAETGTSLLDMRIDTRASRRLTRRIARVRASGDERRALRLEARRREVDQRFDPREALAATGRYLTFARGEVGSDELAIVSYHMGVGNLTGVIEALDEGDTPPYAQVFFDTTPTDHPEAHRRLAELGDDSSTYYWRVLAAREIMRLWRDDRGELQRRAELHTNKASAEEVLHPQEETGVFENADALEDAYRDGDLRSFPNAPARTGLRRDPRMGELAPRLEQSRALYRGLRPGAYGLAVTMADMVREAGGGDAPLRVTSTVRDAEYQELLGARNPEATDRYSLHTTGWSFDVSRDYASGAQAQAFQFALDRLTALNLIAWVREPGAIHITVSRDAEELLDTLEVP
jgi:hypothetical protein